MKNIVKWWKDFLLHFTTLETYCVKGSYLWSGLNLAAKVNRNLSRTLIIDVWLKDTLWASEWTYVARDVSICVGWFVYLLMSLLYVLAKSFCITPARVAFYAENEYLVWQDARDQKLKVYESKLNVTKST